MGLSWPAAQGDIPTTRGAASSLLRGWGGATGLGEEEWRARKKEKDEKKEWISEKSLKKTPLSLQSLQERKKKSKSLISFYGLKFSPHEFRVTAHCKTKRSFVDSFVCLFVFFRSRRRVIFDRNTFPSCQDILAMKAREKKRILQKIFTIR